MSNAPYWVSHRIARRGLEFNLEPTCAGGWRWNLMAKGSIIDVLLFSGDYASKAGARRGLLRFTNAVAKAVAETEGDDG